MEALTKAKVKDNICKLNNYKINKSHHLKLKSIKISTKCCKFNKYLRLFFI